MSKKRICERIGITLAIIGFILAVVVMLFDSHGYFDDFKREHLNIRNAPAIEYPAPSIQRIYTAAEATVEVSAYFDGKRSYGHGIVVRRNDQMFVLTSSMIFNEDVEYITVDIAGWTCITEVLHQNDVWGLVALEYYLLEDVPFIELNDDPNIPPLVVVGIKGVSATTLGYVNDDWVMLGDIPEEDCTGCPVTQNGDVVGIIVGVNRGNRNQAFMVGNRALKEFCDQATLMDIAPIDPNSPYHAPPASRTLIGDSNDGL